MPHRTVWLATAYFLWRQNLVETHSEW